MITDEQLDAWQALADSAINEEWRPVDWTCGGYEVSNFGNVRSNLKRGNHRDKSGPPRLLKQIKNTAGYYTISLPTPEGRYQHRAVHAIVARAFHGPRPFPGHQVAHLNGIKTDNRAVNLAWVTHKENESHKRSHGTDPVGERNGQSALTEWQVEVIKYLAAQGVKRRKIAALFDICHQHVTDIASGALWGHVQVFDRTAVPALIAEVRRLRAAAPRYHSEPFVLPTEGE